MTKPNGIPLYAEADLYTTGPAVGTPTKVAQDPILGTEGFYGGGVNAPAQVNTGQHLIGQWFEYVNEAVGVFASFAISASTGELDPGDPIFLFKTNGQGGIELNDPQPDGTNPDRSTHVKFPAPGIYKVAFQGSGIAAGGGNGWAITAHKGAPVFADAVFDFVTNQIATGGGNPEISGPCFRGVFYFTVADVDQDLLVFSRSDSFFIANDPIQFNALSERYTHIAIQRIK